MKADQIRKKFIDFFEKRGHKIVPSSSLVPDDPSVLFTTAGMQQFKPYYIGKKDAQADFGSLNTASSQKCLRTSDIDEVGDNTHNTFFEMLGNFSFGGYFKKEAINYAYEFITKEMKLEIDYVSIFGGDKNMPEDKESYEIWKSIGIPEGKIKKFGREDNFWGPTGEEGPCGPTTEIYVDGVEIWNIVFNEYYCLSAEALAKEGNKDGSMNLLEIKGVDTGLGLERLTVAMQKKNSVFETDLFTSLMEKIKKASKHENIKEQRIVADHVKASVFLIADGVVPSNTEQGYILRRLIRRAVRYADLLGMESGSLSGLTDVVAEIYKNVYTNILQNVGMIKEVISKEEEKFRKTLGKGLKQFEKGERDPFVLFATYGFPLEMTEELAQEKGETINKEDFWEKMKQHQEVSRAGSEQKFKGGLAGHSPMEIKYHTATHMLHQALREVLGNHVLQKGSNITPERLRFDFSHPEKMTQEEKEKVEDLINEKIEESLPVTFQEVSLEDAKEKGALGVFDKKYGEKVKVYQIGEEGNVFSLEICGGPHVENTSQMGEFKIKKEESVAAGTRRIKAILE